MPVVLSRHPYGDSCPSAHVQSDSLWRALHDLVVLVLVDFAIPHAGKLLSSVSAPDAKEMEYQARLSWFYLSAWGYHVPEYTARAAVGSRRLLLALAWLLAYAGVLPRYRDRLVLEAGAANSRPAPADDYAPIPLSTPLPWSCSPSEQIRQHACMFNHGLDGSILRSEADASEVVDRTWQLYASSRCVSQ